MSHPTYHVGICSICQEGALGIRICGGCEAAVVLCDECDALWMEPTCDEPPEFLQQPDAPCPNCAASLYQDPSHWAERNEIERLGWTDFVQGDSGAMEPDSAESSEVQRNGDGNGDGDGAT